MKRKALEELRDDFLWGASSAAYQVEGAFDKDGKGPSIWDLYSKEEGKTYKGTNGDVACDHYNRYKEDISLMSEMGLKAYRFSISWSRVFPKGRGEINEKGLEFYDDLIDELLKNNIKPIITLYHWDLPQYLQDLYGGWESRQIIDDFNNYCITLFKRYGEKVKHWVTLNEQNIFIKLGYELALHPPGIKDKKRMLQANHIANLANAKVIESFRNYVPNGMIGPSFAYTPVYPKSCDPVDILAAEDAEEIESSWWLDVYARGTYPVCALKYYEKLGIAPIIEDGDIELLEKAVPDFIGINYYQTSVVSGKDLDNEDEIYKSIKNPYLNYTKWNWAVDAKGLEIALRRIVNKYNLPILITENGLGEIDKLEEDDVINDDYRIEYLKNHINACMEAVSDGVELLGYCVWSFTDLLSWLNGYKKRYGLVYVNRDENDLKDLRRIKKKSFYWYKDVIDTNGKKL